MASDLYKPYIQAAMTGGANTDLLTLPVKAVLIDVADYTVDLDTHDFLADVPAGARVATSGNLASKTFTGNTFDAADITISTVSGDQLEAIIITVEPSSSPSDANTRLVAYIDSGTGLPFTPNGSDVDITWNASGIFSL